MLLRILEPLQRSKADNPQPDLDDAQWKVFYCM